MIINEICTEGGARTHTFQGTLDFESSASTSFATSAFKLLINLLQYYSKLKKVFLIWRLNYVKL